MLHSLSDIFPYRLITRWNILFLPHQCRDIYTCLDERIICLIFLFSFSSNHIPSDIPQPLAAHEMLLTVSCQNFTNNVIFTHSHISCIFLTFEYVVLSIICLTFADHYCSFIHGGIKGKTLHPILVCFYWTRFLFLCLYLDGTLCVSVCVYWLQLHTVSDMQGYEKWTNVHSFFSR